MTEKSKARKRVIKLAEKRMRVAAKNARFLRAVGLEPGQAFFHQMKYPVTFHRTVFYTDKVDE